MPRVHKTISEAGQHLHDAAPTIGPRYKIATGKADWVGPTTSPEAQANYEAGLVEANAEGRRISGATKAGNPKYQKGCADKGAAVIGKRIQDAKADYEREFGPVLSAMNDASDRAPAKTRDFRTNINTRLVPVVEAARRAVGKTV